MLGVSWTFVRPAWPPAWWCCICLFVFFPDDPACFCRSPLIWHARRMKTLTSRSHWENFIFHRMLMVFVLSTVKKITNLTCVWLWKANNVTCKLDVFNWFGFKNIQVLHIFTFPHVTGVVDYNLHMWNTFQKYSIQLPSSRLRVLWF